MCKWQMTKSGDMCDVNHGKASCDGPSMASRDMARPPVMASQLSCDHNAIALLWPYVCACCNHC